MSDDSSRPDEQAAASPVPSPAPPPAASSAAAPPPDLPPERLERRAAGLLLFFVALVVASILYVLYARGVFEATQRLVLVADDSEGVQVGMDMTFSGFPIGRVRRIELSPQGNARILIDVPTRDARWLRTSSVFTMSKGLVGGTSIRAYSGILSDPPLPDGAEREVLAGDAAAEIPRMMSEVRALVANLTALTADDSALAQTLGNVQRATAGLDGKLGSKRGALDLLLGQDAPKLVTTIERSNQLLARLDGLAQRADGLVQRADDKLLGDQGLVSDAQVAVRQITALLTDAHNSLSKVDAVLTEAQAVAVNARVATADLGVLRAEVEASLRKVEHLVNEVNRRWPLARDTEIKLP
jgi:phospholipid/cholesterol/gamma-HCH transport system substrate-binding protein